jgi:hypothetical protein
MLGVWSTNDEMHYVYSLAWEGVGQVMMKYILCHRWNVLGLVNTCCDIFCVLAGIGKFWSTQVMIHSRCWHGRGLVNTRKDKF